MSLVDVGCWFVVGIIVFFICLGQVGWMEFGSEFYWFILIGFGVQLVDGVLGMVFGLVFFLVLFSMGLLLVVVSVSIYIVEVFIIGVFGVFYLVVGNVDCWLFLCLVLFGVVGGVFGVYVLIQFFGDVICLFIYVYLLVLVVFILLCVVEWLMLIWEVKCVLVLGFVVGLLDVSGGGGWGLVVIFILLVCGGQVCIMIGMVNVVEFVVILVVLIIFLFLMGLQYLNIVVGLLVGGMMVVLVVVLLVKKVKECWVLVVVGVLVLVISLFQIGYVVYGWWSSQQCWLLVGLQCCMVLVSGWYYVLGCVVVFVYVVLVEDVGFWF